jgi:hypothetical protein
LGATSLDAQYWCKGPEALSECVRSRLRDMRARM